MLWNIVVFSTGEIALGLQAESQTGILEQLFISPHTVRSLFLVRALANQAMTLAMNAVVLGVILLATGVRLHFPWSATAPLLAALAGAYGIGFALGSLVLIFKRPGTLLNLAQFGLVLPAFPPFETFRTGR